MLDFQLFVDTFLLTWWTSAIICSCSKIFYVFKDFYGVDDEVIDRTINSLTSRAFISFTFLLNIIWEDTCWHFFQKKNKQTKGFKVLLSLYTVFIFIIIIDRAERVSVGKSSQWDPWPTSYVFVGQDGASLSLQVQDMVGRRLSFFWNHYWFGLCHSVNSNGNICNK